MAMKEYSIFLSSDCLVSFTAHSLGGSYPSAVGIFYSPSQLGWRETVIYKCWSKCWPYSNGVYFQTNAEIKETLVMRFLTCTSEFVNILWMSFLNFSHYTSTANCCNTSTASSTAGFDFRRWLGPSQKLKREGKEEEEEKRQRKWRTTSHKEKGRDALYCVNAFLEIFLSTDTLIVHSHVLNI